MVQIDGVATDSKKQVLVLAATNLPFDLDDALLRRFQKRIYISSPEKQARIELIKKILSKEKDGCTLSSSELDEIASSTDGYSCSDLASLCRESSMNVIRELGNKVLSIDPSQIRKLKKSDFLISLKKVRPSTNVELVKKLDRWNKEYGSS